MRFEIVVDGSPTSMVLRLLEDVHGSDRVVQGPGQVRIAVADQAAMVGLLNCVNDLGLEIRRVDRADHPVRAASNA